MPLRRRLGPYARLAQVYQEGVALLVCGLQEAPQWLYIPHRPEGQQAFPIAYARAALDLSPRLGLGLVLGIAELLTGARCWNW